MKLREHVDSCCKHISADPATQNDASATMKEGVEEEIMQFGKVLDQQFEGDKHKQCQDIMELPEKDIMELDSET